MRIFIFSIIVILLAGCQDVITLDLGTSSPALVLQAPLYADTAVQTFSLTLSTDYFSTSSPAAATDATISVTDGAGKQYGFSHSGGGQYVCDSLRPQAGQTYTLHLNYGGQTYTATSTMPAATPIDSLAIAIGGGPGGLGGQKTVRCFFTDPAGSGDYFRAKFWLNGVFTADYVALYSDTDNDNPPGSGIGPRRFSVSSGDTVRAELSAIDVGLYTYFSTLSDLTDQNNGQSSVTPTNPTSNISGGAMGYFGGFQRQTATVVVP